MEIRSVESRLEAKIETTCAALRVDVLRWLVMTQGALGGLLSAALTLVR